MLDFNRMESTIGQRINWR